jgi:restriction system protein
MLIYAIIAVILILAASLVFIRLKGISLRKKTSSFAQSLEEIDDLSAIDITRIDAMSDGSEFELYIARLLVELGYNGVYKTTGSHDFGADVVFIDTRGNQTVIQAKRYGLDNPVGLSAVQEVYASKRFYKARNAIVISSSRYTEACETLAGVNHVLLLDRYDLIKIIEHFKVGQYQEARDIIEREPRVILESWTDMKEEYKVIKKDKKADEILKAKTTAQ